MKTWISILVSLAIVAGGCRHVPKEESAGKSSFDFVTQPMPPPLKSEGPVIELTERAQYQEAQLRERPRCRFTPARALKAKAGGPLWRSR